MKRKLMLLAALSAMLILSACGGNAHTNNQNTDPDGSEEPEVRTIVDSAGREVTIPEMVERVVCSGVGALRYTTYLDAENLVVGVEDYETTEGMSRLYNYVNFDYFKDLPVIGTNGAPDAELILTADPQVIVLSSYATADPDELQTKTGIPVVVVPGSDALLDDKTYETLSLLGELYGKESRAEELTDYLKDAAADLDARTKDIPESEKPTVYIGGVSFKGHHGFEGTEAQYGPFQLIHANNLADTTGQTGAFTIDVEQVITWDPDVIFLDFNGMPLIEEDYAKNPALYDGLTAVKEGRVYAQISFRSSAVNVETALADAYYAGSVLYPEAFADIDPVEKTGEIFTTMLGENPYDDLKEAGYAFRTLTLG